MVLVDQNLSKQKKIKWTAFEHFLWREMQKLRGLNIELSQEQGLEHFQVQSQEQALDGTLEHSLENTLGNTLEIAPEKTLEPFPQGVHFLLALSGGADSIALLKALLTIQQAAKIKISTMYVHHGESPDSEVNLYRNKCEVFCRQFCLENKVDFEPSEKPKEILKSEESLRDFRYAQLFAFQKKIGAEILVTAHHRDDLLETRLLRLIRGTGPDGIASMKTWQSNIWRPLLKTSKQELYLYLKERSVDYIDDPSNSSSDYLRNWLRNEWLPQLEQKATGSVNSLARSLEILAENLEYYQSQDREVLLIQSIKNQINIAVDGSDKNLFFVNRLDLLSLGLVERKQCIVKLLKRANINNISHGQVNEILKQLDNPQKVHKFKIGNCVWVVDAERVFVETK